MDTKQPIQVKEPVPNEESSEIKEPGVSNEPVAGSEPVASNEPVASIEPVVSNELVAGSESVASNEPIASIDPVATIEPDANNTPVIIDPPNEEMIEAIQIVSPQEQRKSTIYRLTSMICFILMIAEFVLGIKCNSLALTADSARLLSDYLGSFKISKTYSKTRKIIEISALLTAVVVCWVLFILFVYISGQRLYSKKVDIDSKWMLVASVIATIGNVGICVLHGDRIFEPRRYTPIGDFLNIRLHQAFHVVISHGLGFIVVLAAILIFISDNFIYMDSIAAIIISLLLLANTTVIINNCKVHMLKKYEYTSI